MAKRMFVGREKELGRLERIYSGDGLKTCVVFGRRQIGKSALIRKFCEGKRHLFLQSSDSSAYENRVRMVTDISEFLGKEMEEYDSFTRILKCVADICRQEKTVVVFDEYPYVLRTAPEFASILQRFIDIDVADTDSMVILCGSSMSVMCDEIESHSRPLYGRFTDRNEVKELPLRDCERFHPNMSRADIVKLYLTFGGVPKYHAMMDESTYRGCITDHFLSEWADLRNEAPNLITNELPSNVYTSIAACIANGSTSQSEIADKIHCERPNCKMYLDRLEKTGIVRRVTPMLGASKRPLYRIADGLVAFHYSVLARRETMIEGPLDASEKYKRIEGSIDTLLGRRFEELCGKYLETHRNVESRGKWWGKDGDIDVVAKAIDENGRTVTIACECKFTRKKMYMSDLEGLQSAVERIGCDNVEYVLFSASGFDAKLVERASENNIGLISLDDLFD